MEGGRFEGMYERARQANPLEVRLDTMALERGHEKDLATPERSAEWILFQRMMYLLIEKSQEWDPQQRANLRKIITAFGALAFSRFTEIEQSNFMDNFMGFYEDEGKIELDRTQAVLVSRISQRVGIPFASERTTLTFTPPEIKTRRISEVEDPKVTELLRDAPSEYKIDYLLRNIRDLTLKQRVKLLLSLSDEEYKEFKARRKAGFDDLVGDILSKPDLIPDRLERIKAVSRLRDGTPRYEIEADIRRRWNGKYPSAWDKDLEEDSRFKENDGLPRMRNGIKITYEEAIEFARFELARKFYRGIYFPLVTRRDNPVPISIDTLYNAFQEYRKSVAKGNKPGTDISTKDLQSVIEYYLGYEPDNEENCTTHRQVQVFVKLVVAIENALEQN